MAKKSASKPTKKSTARASAKTPARGAKKKTTSPAKKKATKAASTKKPAAKKPRAKAAKTSAANATSPARKPAKPSAGRTSAKRAVAKSAKSAKPPAATRAKSPTAAAKRGAGNAAATSGSLRKTVDGYAASLNDWRKDCIAKLRTMIRTAAPTASEQVKWSQPVYEHHGPFAWIKAHAKHVNLGFWRGVELPDPRKLLAGTGDKMRHIKLKNLKDAGMQELQEFVRVAARLNEIKGSPTRPARKKAKSK